MSDLRLSPGAMPHRERRVREYAQEFPDKMDVINESLLGTCRGETARDTAVRLGLIEGEKPERKRAVVRHIT